jgi:hypothetical protein
MSCCVEMVHSLNWGRSYKIETQRADKAMC